MKQKIFIDTNVITTSHFRDIEDAMQHYAAMQSECDVIITRNVKDFSQSDIPVFSPDEYLKSFKY